MLADSWRLKPITTDNTFTQQLIGTGFVRFEQHRLFTTNGCHRFAAQHHTQVGSRRTVISQNLTRQRSIRQIVFDAERRIFGAPTAREEL
jgi:hypothetical protein